MIITEALLCLSLNIYHEARSEGYDGMAAVAIVTMNRAGGQEERICEEVFRPKQFSWANSLTTVSPQQRIKNAPRFAPKDKAAWAAAKVVAHQALTGQLSSHIRARVSKADHYYNPDKANPRWKDSMHRISRIGDHVFFKG